MKLLVISKWAELMVLHGLKFHDCEYIVDESCKREIHQRLLNTKPTPLSQ